VYHATEFVLALVASAVALVVAGAVADPTERARHSTWVPFTGIATTVAALWVISLGWPIGAGAVFGVAGVAAVAGLSNQADWRGGPVGAAIVATPFAAFLAFDASPIGWVRAVVTTAVAVGAVAAARTDARWASTGLTPTLYAVAVAGVFAAVPDTEEATALLAASAAGAVAGWPFGRARLGTAGAGGATALLAWVVAVDGRGRTPAIAGAVACLGLLVALSIGRWFVESGTGRAARTFTRPIPVLACQVVVVYVASRVAGVSHHLDVAVAAGVAAMVLALGAGIAMARPALTQGAHRAREP
jgi:hypothetical protein